MESNINWTATLAAQGARVAEANDDVLIERRRVCQARDRWLETPRLHNGTPEEAVAARDLARWCKALSRAIEHALAEEKVMKRFVEASETYQ